MTFEVSKEIGHMFKEQLNKIKSILYNEAPENISDNDGFRAVSIILSKLDTESIIDEIEEL